MHAGDEKQWSDKLPLSHANKHLYVYQLLVLALRPNCQNFLSLEGAVGQTQAWMSAFMLAYYEFPWFEGHKLQF
jgi:hypothetical protein